MKGCLLRRGLLQGPPSIISNKNNLRPGNLLSTCTYYTGSLSAAQVARGFSRRFLTLGHSFDGAPSNVYILPTNYTIGTFPTLSHRSYCCDPHIRNMSHTVHNTNKACCSIPPVQSNYTPKGEYRSVGRFNRVYVTGAGSNESALVSVYDIFGFYPQTRQGADILAEALNTTVYMPDFFEPNEPYPTEKFPPKDEQEGAELQNFFGTTAEPEANTAKLVEFGNFLRATAGVKKLGVYGFCWGGKVTIKASSSEGKGTPFDAAAIVHPAMLSVDDASKLELPLGIYISKDEPVEEYEKIVDVISKKSFASKNDSKNYTDMFHGWAAARANLEDEENKKQFHDVYTRLAHFFQGAW